MAAKSSSTKAQVHQQCNMCEETAEVKFRCLDCDYLLCLKCRKMHAKVKALQKHTVVDLKDETVVVTKSIAEHANNCHLHKDETYIMYCKDCEQLVCPSCIIENHQKHTLGDMKVVLQKINFIEKYGTEIDQNILPNISRKLAVCEDLITFHTKKAETTKSKIKDWLGYFARAVEKAVKNQTQDFYEEIDKNVDEIKTRLLPQVSTLNEMKKEVQEIRKKIDTLSSCKDLSKTADLETSIDELSKNLNKIGTQERTKFLEFVGTEFKTSLLPILGELRLRAVFELNLVSSIATAVNSIDKIISCNNNQILVRNWESRKMWKFKLENKKAIELGNWAMDVKDIAALRSGDILLILADKTEVRHIPYLRQFDSDHTQSITDISAFFFDTAPQIPTTVHVTRKNNVILSTVEPGRDWLPMDSPCKVQIIVLTEQGHIISRFDYDKDLFCFPNRIASFGSDICVADSISDYSGRLVTLDSTGKVRWTYGDEEQNSVVIADMVSTPLSNIILFDACQRVLRALDSEGRFLNTWRLQDFSINDAYAMTMSSDEKLLIGSGHMGKNLHVLELRE
ncbi:unnamed protein product [Mytilus coruscus]|uniref:B box-type domain-containing protein n=1 Tax=Mytilus coruscus TaxID=42192 RepID=A0A6J8BDE9_MYTCO|nr:unnamed protein product [Mytilus coruscus]